MPITNSGKGSCCTYSKGSHRTAGNGRIFSKVRPSPLETRFVVGSGVGARNASVSRALKRRAGGVACCSVNKTAVEYTPPEAAE